MIKNLSLLFALAFGLFACAADNNTAQSEAQPAAPPAQFEEEPNLPDNTLSQKEAATGWKLLFDGKSADGWRGFQQEGMPSGWSVENGTLKASGQGGDAAGDILYGAQMFESFELTVDWKIAEGGNSGIFYHVREEERFSTPYETGPEYQIIDEENFPEPLEPWQVTGADYAMFEPSIPRLTKPAGEWNTSTITFTPQQATYTLNGRKTIGFYPNSIQWQINKKEGKWKDYPDYGKVREGYIGLQDHGSEVWFKNIKIREL